MRQEQIFLRAIIPGNVLSKKEMCFDLVAKHDPAAV